MKRLILVLTLVFAALFLVACGDSGKVLEDDAHVYYLTGQLAGWGDAVGNNQFLMTAIAKNDDRVKSISKDLKNAKYIYIIEATFPAGEAGWEVSYKIDGKDVEVDGNLTLKILQVNKGEEAPNWWAQAPESGEVKNLTPDTLYLPPFVEENVDGAGGWNDNPIVFAAGTYYIVYVQYSNTEHGLAAIKK